MEFSGTYKGAAFFKDLDGLNAPMKKCKKKVRSEGVHPDINNLKVEFSAFGDSWKEAEKEVVKQIDAYLNEHDLKEFDFDKLDLKK